MKNLMMFKNEDKKAENQPDYRVVATIEGQDGMFTVGAGWIKDGAKGKFMSIKLQDAREYEYEGVKGTSKGYHLVDDSAVQPKQTSDAPPTEQESQEITAEELADSIPF